jgi:hypothetical protein
MLQSQDVEHCVRVSLRRREE